MAHSRQAAYRPFGLPLSGNTTDSLFGFTGEQTDGTGLQYLRARYYSPQHGRFLSVDPFEGMARRPYSQHPYQYGYSNPLLYTDPSGEVVEGCLIGYKKVYKNGEFAGCEEDPDFPEWLSWLKGTIILPGPMAIGAPGAVAGGAGGPAISTGRQATGAVWGKLAETYLAYLAYITGKESLDNTVTDSKTRDRNNTNQMRVQLQQGFKETHGIPLMAPAKTGVTTQQVRGGLYELYEESDKLSWFPSKSLRSWLHKSIIKIKPGFKTLPINRWSKRQ